MKKIFLLCCVLIFISLLAISAFAEQAKPTVIDPATGCPEGKPCVTDPCSGINADNICYSKTPIDKLGRGVINTATAWMEIPAEVVKVSSEHGPFVGYTLGVADGIFTTLLRGATGIFDAVTFLIPPYGKPLMQPEYAIKSLEDKFNKYGEE